MPLTHIDLTNAKIAQRHAREQYHVAVRAIQLASENSLPRLRLADAREAQEQGAIFASYARRIICNDPEA